MKKQVLRQLYLKKRNSITTEDYEKRNRLLLQHFFSSSLLNNVSVVHSFVPIRQNKEPDTFLFIDHILQHPFQIRISLPKVVNDGGALVHLYYENRTQLKENKWGIPEPTHGDVTPVNEIDLVLVPLLCFSPSGQRVGYGKGFYDRFLSTCRPDCKRVGLSLFETPEMIEDVNEWDIPLHHCVTPAGILSF